MYRLIGISLLLLYFFSSCAKNEDDRKLVINVTQLELWESGSQKTVSINVYDKDDNVIDMKFDFSWRSENESVATVDSLGVVMAKAVGETTIIVRLDNLEASVKVIVDYTSKVVSGAVRYEDKIYDVDGFTGATVFKAARFILLDIVDKSGNIQHTLTTDAKGKFSVSLPATREYDLHILAKTNAESGFDFEVRNSANQLYGFVSPLDSNVLSIDMLSSVEFTGSFNILDVLVTGAEFFQSFTQQQDFTLQAFWTKNKNIGTYYCTAQDLVFCKNGPGIYVFNDELNDTDEYDDDVLWHEFAHYLSFILSRDDSPGGCHFLDSTDLDLRLAWSEGWGDFFPLILKDWLSKDENRKNLLSTAQGMSSTHYVDTVFNGVQLSFDINNLSPDEYFSAASEVAISSVLWEFYSVYGVDPIWGVFENYFNGLDGVVNFEAFWDGWLQLNKPPVSEVLTLQNILLERKIGYREDVFESDDDINSARVLALGIAESHTLYKRDVADLDIIGFNTQQGIRYSVKTLNLSNGADTYLRVLDTQGSLLGSAENDDADPSLYEQYDPACGGFRVFNNATALASQVEFTAPATGIYYVEISAPTGENAYPSAGRYGGYDLLIEALP